jgi:HPt (histidine-containing phosphotransfer) domain-containing protein
MMDISAAADVVAPPLLPGDEAIDLAHLSRMTLGDASLEREVLQLFDRQAAMLLRRMGAAPPALIAASAHTIKGSARGIGAWRVAAAAETVELAAGSAGAAEVRIALDRLCAALDQARTAIGDLLRSH